MLDHPNNVNESAVALLIAELNGTDQLTSVRPIPSPALAVRDHDVVVVRNALVRRDDVEAKRVVAKVDLQRMPCPIEGCGRVRDSERALKSVHHLVRGQTPQFLSENHDLVNVPERADHR